MAGTRNGLEIRAELMRRGMSIADVGILAKVSRPLASRTVNGLENNRKVLQALVAIGVPKKWLALPEDMKKGKEAA
ncbi:MAG: helix-turn-helix domain-containing protein [Solidesulfovibrio sp. DCME]|uniref:helix-turn-helix domain-containing protein n=1 Tax=Solidesulfovibrio sp. DCME TaxID=3447380 RepID=UPI003D142CC8